MHTSGGGSNTCSRSGQQERCVGCPAARLPYLVALLAGRICWHCAQEDDDANGAVGHKQAATKARLPAGQPLTQSSRNRLPSNCKALQAVRDGKRRLNSCGQSALDR